MSRRTRRRIRPKKALWSPNIVRAHVRKKRWFGV